MRLLLALLTFLAFAQAGQAGFTQPQPTYKPVGPKVYVRATVSNSASARATVRYDMYLTTYFDYYGAFTSDKASAKVFIYDKDRTDALFVPFTNTPSGYFVVSDRPDLDEFLIQVVDAQHAVSNGPLIGLKCKLATAGSNELTCGDQTTATRSFCLQSGAYVISIYKSSVTSYNAVCGSGGLSITSIYLEYVDPVSTTSSSSSSISESSTSSSSSSSESTTSSSSSSSESSSSSSSSTSESSMSSSSSSTASTSISTSSSASSSSESPTSSSSSSTAQKTTQASTTKASTITSSSSLSSSTSPVSSSTAKKTTEASTTKATTTASSSSSPSSTPSPTLSSTPVGRKAYVRFSVSGSSTEQYFMAQGSNILVTRSKDLATVFTYDKGGTKSLSLPSTGTASNSNYLNYYLGPSRVSTLGMINEANVQYCAANGATYDCYLLACTLTSAGTDELICGDQNVARTSFCLQPRSSLIYVYHSSERSSTQACGTGAVTITSLKLEYYIDPVSITSSSSSSSTTKDTTSTSSISSSSSTADATTEASSTEASTTEASTTEAFTTEASSTEASTTEASTTTTSSITTSSPTSSPAPYYTPAGPRAYIRVVSPSTTTVAYLMRDPQSGRILTTSYEEFATVFIYDKDRTNSFFIPSDTISGPGYLLPWYAEEGLGSVIGLDDSQTVRELAQGNSQYKLLACAISTTTDELICGDSTVASQDAWSKFCLRDTSFYLTIRPGGSSVADACGSTNSGITSLKIDYIDPIAEPTSTSSESTSSEGSTSTSTESTSEGPLSTSAESTSAEESTSASSSSSPSSTPSPASYYVPVGPQVRVRAVVSNSDTELYVRSDYNYNRYIVALPAQNPRSATVFTYDRDRTNYLFISDAASESGYRLPWYDEDDTTRSLINIDPSELILGYNSSSYQPLACKLTPAGTNEVICGDQATTARLFCVSPQGSRFLLIYPSPAVTAIEACGSEDALTITSFRFEYIDSVVSSSSSFSSSVSSSSTGTSSARDQASTSSEPPGVSSNSESSTTHEPSSSSQILSTSEVPTTAEPSTSLSSASFIVSPLPTIAQSTGTFLESQSSIAASGSSTDLSTASTSQLSSSLSKSVSLFQTSQRDQATSSSSSRPTSESKSQSPQGGTETTLSSPQHSTAASTLPETRGESSSVSIPEPASSSPSTSNPLPTTQTTVSNEVLSDISTTSLVPTLMSPDGTSLTSHEQTYELSTTGSPGLPPTTSESFAGVTSGDHATSQPTGSATTSQAVSLSSPLGSSQTLTSVSLSIISSLSSPSSPFRTSQQTVATPVGSDSSSLTTTRSALPEVASTLVNSLSRVLSTSQDSSQPTTTLLPATSGRNIIGIEKIIIVLVTRVLEPRDLLYRRQGDIITRTVSILHRDIYTSPVPGQPYYPAVIGYPLPDETLTVTTVSTLNVPPDETPKFTYQLCSDCAPVFVIRAVPGYKPGACDGCILDAVFDFPRSTLDVYSSTSTESTLSSIAGISPSSTDAYILIPYLTSSPSGSPSFTGTSPTGPSNTVDNIIPSAIDGGGLVTVVTGTETLTETVTSTIYLPASAGGGGEFDRVVTTCYPVTTCSEFTTTLTIPPESCTTYTTTNEVNNQVETRTEPVPWWTPTFPTPMEPSATGSQKAVLEMPDSATPGSATEILAEPDAGSVASPHLPAGNKVSESPVTQPNNPPLSQPNTAPAGDEVKDDAPVSGNPGLALPAQQSGNPNFSPSGKNVGLEEGSPVSVPSSPPATDVGVVNTTSDTNAHGAGSDSSPEAAQAIGCRARKATAVERLIAVIGITLLLVSL